MDNKLQVLVLHSLELRLLRKRLRHLLNQRYVVCLRKLAFLVDYCIYANRLQSQQNLGCKGTE